MTIMRTQDENKKDAIVEATISLLNEIGFANLSMSQIAKKAGVSSSTLYVYFENKDDMLKKIYLEVKRLFSASLLSGVEQSAPVRQVMEQLIYNILDFALKQTAYFFYMEQFSNAPRLDQSSADDLAAIMAPVYEIFERGQQEGISKKADPALLLSFCYHATTQLVKNKLKYGQSFSDVEIKTVTQMCWDAIKA